MDDDVEEGQDNDEEGSYCSSITNISSGESMFEEYYDNEFG